MDQVAQVREKTDLVALISEHLPLKKAGRNFKTLCPFHSEKSPSFIISPERQIWHCFGCGKGGDCFTFLMESEKMEFVEALRILARRSGTVLIQTYKGEALSQKEKLYKINKQALEFYHFLLTKHSVGKKALSYLLDKRGLKQQIIETFKLGFAPSLGNALVDYLIKKKGLAKEDVLAAGLAFLRGGRIVDFFANRIIFPIFDHRENIVGFSGRVINDTQKSSKYINTRETLIYHKGSVFFGLNIAKESIKKMNRVIVVEGEFDVISLFQEGVDIAIAIKGTALTENHASLLARFAKKVSLCLDQDSAGWDATKRSLSALEKKGLEVSVIETPSGKDPDEAIKTDPLLFKKAVKHDVSIYEFMLNKSLLAVDVKSSQGKRQVADELLPVYADISNEIIKEHYLRKLAAALDTSYESIQKQVDKTAKNVEFLSKVVPEAEKKDRRETLERYLIALIVQYKNLKSILTIVNNIISGINWDIPAYKKIYQGLLAYFETAEVFDSKNFLLSLGSELHSAFDTCYLLPIAVFEDNQRYEEEVKKVAEELRFISVRLEIKLVGEQIRKRESALTRQANPDDDTELDLLKKKFTTLATLLKSKI